MSHSSANSLMYIRDHRPMKPESTTPSRYSGNVALSPPNWRVSRPQLHLDEYQKQEREQGAFLSESDAHIQRDWLNTKKGKYISQVYWYWMAHNRHFGTGYYHRTGYLKVHCLFPNHKMHGLKKSTFQWPLDYQGQTSRSTVPEPRILQVKRQRSVQYLLRKS